MLAATEPVEGETELLDEPTPASTVKVDKVDKEPKGTPTPTAKAKRAPKDRAPRRSPDLVIAGPRYLELIRKEARFADEHLDALNVLTRQLNKARRGRGERITDNTLIRVAVDLLLQKQHQLNRTTEDELRSSVSL
jgi:hypothetical protein